MPLTLITPGTCQDTHLGDYVQVKGLAHHVSRMGEHLGVPMALKSNRRVGSLGSCRDDPELHAYLKARHAMMLNPATGVAVAKNMLNGGLPFR